MRFAMRPDEHKQKRSSAYKKKRGLAQSQDQKQPETRENKKPTTNEASSTSKVSPFPKENDEPRQEVSAFTRKPIESNWDRYQPVSDEEADCGEDFNVLLSFAGDASSHFKLKYEEDWETEPTNFEILAIDQKHLSNALSCIPFVEKYNLSDLDIDPEMLEYISEINESELLKLSSAAASTSTANDLGFDFSSAPKQHNLSIQTNERQRSNEELDFARGIDAFKLERKSQEAILLSEPFPARTSAVKSAPDDDKIIDELLSGRKEVEIIPSDVVDAPAEGHEVAENEIQKNETENGLAGKKDTEVGDLEDWLDSIL